MVEVSASAAVFVVVVGFLKSIITAFVYEMDRKLHRH